MKRRAAFLLCVTLVCTICGAAEPASGAGDAKALQTAVLQSRTADTFFNSAMKLLAAGPTENPSVWVKTAADVDQPWGIRCFAMRALLERFVHEGDDLGEVAKRLGIVSWFKPAQIVQQTVGGVAFDDSRLATDTIFMLYMPNQPEDFQYYVYIRLGAKDIFPEDVSSAAAGKEPKLTITGVLSLKHEFNDLRVRGGPR